MDDLTRIKKTSKLVGVLPSGDMCFNCYISDDDVCINCDCYGVDEFVLCSWDDFITNYFELKNIKPLSPLRRDKSCIVYDYINDDDDCINGDTCLSDLMYMNNNDDGHSQFIEDEIIKEREFIERTRKNPTFISYPLNTYSCISKQYVI